MNIIPFKGRRIELTEPILLYRNLLLKGRWYSISQYGFVVGHIQHPFQMIDCSFLIKESEWKRALRVGQRNVHAMIQGKLVTTKHQLGLPLSYKLKEGKFYCSGTPITSAKYIYSTENGLSCLR